MITFNIEQPFLQKDIDEKVNVEKKSMIEYFSKMLKWGLASLLIGVVTIYFFDLITSNGLKFFVVIFWEAITVFLIMIPLIIKPRIVALIEAPYFQASPQKLHDCKAFLIMPGMEQYKEYAEKVKSQGRELTYFECDEIIKYWNTLATK